MFTKYCEVRQIKGGTIPLNLDAIRPKHCSNQPEQEEIAGYSPQEK
jgi:hypothetical protein